MSQEPLPLRKEQEEQVEATLGHDRAQFLTISGAFQGPRNGTSQQARIQCCETHGRGPA